MSKKGNILLDNAVYIILLVLFLAGMYAFVSQQRSGAGVWEDFYVKEVVKVIEVSDPGDVVELDVHRATEVAQKNKVPDFNRIFMFDNEKDELCVKLNNGQRKTCYSYFNDINIVNVELVKGKPVNILRFEVVGRGEDESS